MDYSLSICFCNCKFILRYFYFSLYLISSIAWAINPDANYLSTPANFALPYTQITVNTTDGYELNTWIIPSTVKQSSKRVLIMAYGDTGNMSYWLTQAKAFCNKGYTLILFDYRGFGKSSYFAIDPSFLYYNEFGTDLACIIEWAKEQFTGQKVGIYAFSMGTLAATLALQQQSASFLIAEGFVVNPTVVQKRLKTVYSKSVLLPSDAQNYNLALQKLNLPILLFAGIHDPITMLNDSKLLVKKQKNSTLIPFNGKHGEGFTTLSNDKYINEISLFLLKIGF